MKYEKHLKTIEDIIGDNHLSTNVDTPLRDDAFKLSCTTLRRIKINKL